MAEFLSMLVIKSINLFVLTSYAFLIIGLFLFLFFKFEDAIFDKINFQEELLNKNIAVAIVLSTILFIATQIIVAMIS